MLLTLFLAMLLMIAGIGRAAVSDLQATGKFNDRTLGCKEGRHKMRKELHHQVKNSILRSLDLESFNIKVSPTSSKVSSPDIIGLFPPTLQTPHQHINMPMRFGRDGDDHIPNSIPNLPQRFGRSWKLIQPCKGCSEAHRALKHPLKYARSGLSFIRTLLNAQLLKAGLHWA